MDILFLLLVIWTFYSIYMNVIKHRDYKYLVVLFLSGFILSFIVKGRCWWLFLTLLATNLYYAYLMFQSVAAILGQLFKMIQK